MNNMKYQVYLWHGPNGYDQRDGESWDYLIISWST